MTAKDVATGGDAETPENEVDFGGALTKHLDTFIRLNRRKKELQKELRDIKDEMRKLEPIIQDALLQAGIQNVTRRAAEGMPKVTVYIYRQKWASPADGNRERAVQVLQELGYDEMVVPQHQSVSTLFRGDPEKVQEELHPDLLDAFEVTEKVSVRVRKA